jgi:cytochrome P450
MGNRMTPEAFQYEGYEIPADHRVMYSIYLAHRDKQHWDSPDAFMPERFNPGPGAAPTPFSYLPFGGGPRNCIGAVYAHVEARVILAQILTHFDLHHTGHSVHPHMGATLEPRPGVRMRVKRIK